MVCTMLKSRQLLVASEDIFRQVGTNASVRNWMAEDRCRVVGLSARFGLCVPICKVCDICKRGGGSRLAVAASNSRDRANESKHKALNLLGTLEGSFCLVCKSERCEGEHCLGKHCCFACGGDHLKANCRVQISLSVSRGPGACYYCLDLKSREGYAHHRFDSCPTKRRLKRIVIEGWRQQTAVASFGDFLASVYSGSENFYAFLSDMGTRLGTSPRYLAQALIL